MKGQQSAFILLILLLFFLGVIFWVNRAETPEVSTTTTTSTSTTLPVETTTTSTTLPSTSKCKGTNNRVCSYGSKYDCVIAKCCYWDLNILKCKPKACSDVLEEFCASCGCSLSQ